MSSFILKHEQNTFEKKGWKGLAIFTLILRMLFGIVTFIFTITVFSEEVKNLKKYLKK
ncbi:MAG: hypothetical protein JXR68_10815 [Bacteroidales bacterium]|nr:hypothetical protein [Bacteroidales bacterium]